MRSSRVSSKYVNSSKSTHIKQTIPIHLPDGPSSPLRLQPVQNNIHPNKQTDNLLLLSLLLSLSSCSPHRCTPLPTNNNNKKESSRPDSKNPYHLLDRHPAYSTTSSSPFLNPTTHLPPPYYTHTRITSHHVTRTSPSCFCPCTITLLTTLTVYINTFPAHSQLGPAAALYTKPHVLFPLRFFAPKIAKPYGRLYTTHPLKTLSSDRTRHSKRPSDSHSLALNIGE